MSVDNAQIDTTSKLGTLEPSSKRISSLVSRNVVVLGSRTSIRLEPEMWDGLREICDREHSNIHNICTNIAIEKRQQSSLTASIRVFVMRYFRFAATEEGHTKAGHGRLSNVIPLSDSRVEKQVRTRLTSTSFR